MSIKVLYFASLKELVGRDGDECSFEPALSVKQIWQRLNPQQPIPNPLLAAINMDYVDLDCVVSDGDELAFFPPVTGG